MALERDNQHIEAVVDLGTEDLTESVEAVTGAVDTRGMRSLSFVIIPSGAVDPADEIILGAEDSPDGVTFTDVEAIKLLPSEHYPTQYVVNAANGYLQTLGIVSAERYVRLTINPDVLGGEQALKILAIMHPENLAFRAWDPNAVTDGLP